MFFSFYMKIIFILIFCYICYILAYSEYNLIEMEKQSLSIEEKQRLLTKHLKTLVISGEALIAFGLISFLQTILSSLLNEEDQLANYLDETSELPVGVQFGILFFVLFVIGGIFASIFILTGISAYKEGHGKKRGFIYLIFTFLLFVLYSANLVYTILQPSSSDSVIRTFANILLFASIVYCTFDILNSAIKSRKLKRN